MCGIVGYINYPDEITIDEIQHRGPDGYGTYLDNKVQLGHTRLSILDLSESGSQPFHSQDGKHVMVFNGEIYNHLEIREELINLGYSFRSESDTETLLNGFIEFGEIILKRLNGIFSFCIYNKLEQTIFMARDRFGVKPFYYFLNDNVFGFSSELKSFVNKPILDSKLDPEALSNYVRFLWSPGEITPLKGVKKLLPGRSLSIDLKEKNIDLQIKAYFKSGFNGTYSPKSEKELTDELEELLVAAVKRQLLSDVPVGFFLSGGLDSSLIVAIARKLMPEKSIQCFTIDTSEFGSTEGFSNDLEFAHKVAKYLKVELDVVKAEASIVQDFDRMIWHLDEPQADPAPLNVYNISARAKEMGYKVLLGGSGGDDVFSGYRRHQALGFEKYIKPVPRSVLKVIGATGKFLNAQKPTQRRIKKIVDNLEYSGEDRLFGYFEWLKNNSSKKLFSKEFKSILENSDPFRFFREKLAEIPEEKNDLNKMLHLEMNTFLVDHNFNYTDKMGMAAGIEIRVPFLDNDLVEFSYSLPPELKLNGKETKYILKKVAEKYLPKEVIYRSKAGFGAPVRKWINEDLRSLINDRLSFENLKQNGIFEAAEVRKIIEDNRTGKIDASYSIWAILAIDSWAKQFLEKA